MGSITDLKINGGYKNIYLSFLWTRHQLSTMWLLWKSSAFCNAMSTAKNLREADQSVCWLQPIVRGMPSPAVFCKMRNVQLACVSKIQRSKANRAKTDPATKRNCHHTRPDQISPLKWGPRHSWAWAWRWSQTYITNSNNNNKSLWLDLHRGETYFYTFSNDDLKNKTF